ncbi:MAG: methionine--tRNA ligase, partial [Oscillospiraceae bacterium]|nr:methionine--tRNA ligase [Oscillospiraceae bacterium]
EFIESNENFIYPEARKKEMLNNFIKPGLQDLCVSRTSFKWGVPVTFDDKHVIYVWIDALSNYITALGYDPDGSSEQYKKYWPADVHIIGKDIVRFHTIYWPIMLMALGEPLPKQVYGHPWLLFGEDKMSKSRGNVIYADDLTKVFGVDAVRYYLLTEMPHANDGSITYEAMIERFNTDLANTLGNLVNRTVTMQNKYFEGVIQPCDCCGEFDEELKAAAKKAIEGFDKNLSEYKMSDAIDCIMDLARRCNKYIDETMPWALAKDEANKARLGTVLYNLLEGIRILSVLIAPIMPETTKKIVEQLGIDEQSYESIQNFGGLEVGGKVGTAMPLFSRIDAEKLIAELEAAHKAQLEAEKAEEKPVIELQPEIAIDDFTKVELRVAKILECEKVPKAKKLYKIQLDDGMGGCQIVSGIAQHYTPEELIGKKIVVVANLKPAKLCGVESRGMLLAGDREDGSVCVTFIDDSVPVGTRLH